METKNMKSGILLILSFAIVGAAVAWLLSAFISYSDADVVKATYKPGPGVVEGDLLFAPPKADEAPEDIRDAVVLGYNILKYTQQYVPDYIGNKLNCTNCHFDAGRERKTLSLVGVAAKYPKYRKRHDYSSDLVTRTNGCFQRSQNGKPLPPDSKEMQAIMAYYHWISLGIPIYAEIQWLGLKHLNSDHQPDKNAGQVVFSEKCQMCHGADGHGTRIAPALWGPGSYNDGAGMSKVPNLAAFAHLYMPKGNPDMSVVEALNVAAFVDSQPRPHFE